jgi:GntR family transcriptional repressor for pyruvate dehydrogenase complex
MKGDGQRKEVIGSFKAIADGKRAHERIVDQVKGIIFEKKIHPGERLPTERALAEIFNTSRVTVRAAILTLRKEGLVDVKKGMSGGTFIAEDIGQGWMSEILRDFIQWKDISIHHVLEVRGMIEPEVAYLAAKNATPEDIEAIWVTIRELGHFFSVRSKFQSTDENFHKALAFAAKNPLLSFFQAALIDVLFKFIYGVVWKEEHKDSILQHHSTIAKKVEERDHDGAREAMLTHLADMHDILSLLPVSKASRWIND